MSLTVIVVPSAAVTVTGLVESIDEMVTPPSAGSRSSVKSRFSHDRFVSFGIGQHSAMYVITMEDFVALTGAEKQTSSTDSLAFNL